MFGLSASLVWTINNENYFVEAKNNLVLLLRSFSHYMYTSDIIVKWSLLFPMKVSITALALFKKSLRVRCCSEIAFLFFVN